MRFAYADPPYVGCGHYYPEKAEVDQIALIDRLIGEYPDGWALSCSSPSLQRLLSCCPPDVRVMAWVKPFAVFKPNVGVAYAWEPVIVRGGRRRTREQFTVRDWVSIGITLKKGLVGAKPPEFCAWLLEVLNVQPDDMLDDLYPGTGSMSAALKSKRRQETLAFRV